MAGIATREHIDAGSSVSTNRLNWRSPQGQGRRGQGTNRNNDKHNRPNQQPWQANSAQSCYRCGGSNHKPDDCRFREVNCHSCGKKGHIQRACRSGAKGPQSQNSSQNQTRTGGHRNHSVSTSYRPMEDGEPNVSSSNKDTNEQYVDSVNTDESDLHYGLYHTLSGVKTNKPYLITLVVGDTNVPITMEIDTGAARSTISEHVYKSSLAHYPIKDTNITLRGYSGEKVPVIGSIVVTAKYGGTSCRMDLLVVKGSRPSLFGRDHLSKIKLDWENIFVVSEPKPAKVGIQNLGNPVSPTLENLLSQNQKIFSSSEMGIKGFSARLRVKAKSRPKYQKSRPVPYSLLSKVENEYEKLIKNDIVTQVNYSEWASPVVHVQKGNGEIRVCGDYKALNDCIEDEGYKLPNTNDLFAKLAQGGTHPKVFSVLDLSGAFNQLFLDDESARLLVMNTHKGLLSPKRLCYGVKTAPAIFQETMDKILSGLDNVFCYIDDILIATENENSHLKALDAVFARLNMHNVRLNGTKCQFMKSKIRYLGHELTSEGVSPLQDKIEAIQKAPRPTNVSELKSFLGMVNYYGKFVRNLSSQMQPLYALLQHNINWVWSDDCEQAFVNAKNALASNQVLTHFDPNKPLVLSVDASPCGLGAVLGHRYPDGSDRPIAYASRTLSQTEKNYAQIEKEALAIIFGIKKFHLYLYGTNFTLITDHQPLTKIFGPKHGIPALAAARMQRWAVLLSAYQYNIEYRSSAKNANADLLSRLPVGEASSGDPEEYFVFETVLMETPITATEISKHTDKDPVLAKVLEFTLSGWPNHCVDPAIQPYFTRRDELSLEDGCLIWGRRVIIPSKLHELILSELHECHPGMSRMKALARCYVWWPGLDKDIEDKVRLCTQCIQVQKAPNPEPLLLWPWATQPWQRVHIDYAEVKGQNFLLVVDSHSKWLEVLPMNTTTSTATINVLRTLFARYGLPIQLVSDNGPQFRSEEFQNFLKSNGVDHTLTPPYHPATNGLAERNVQTFKNAFAKSSGETLGHKVANVLFTLRNTPNTTTGKTPSELFLKRSPRTRLSLVKPSLQRKVEKRQDAAKQQRDRSSSVRQFDLYQPVRVRNVRGGKDRWIPGTIVKVKGPRTYIVRIPGNNRRFVHSDHLIPDDTGANAMAGKPNINSPMDADVVSVPVNVPQTTRELGQSSNLDQPGPSTTSPVVSGSPVHTGQTPVVVAESPAPSATVTRSGRVVRPPKRLEI